MPDKIKYIKIINQPLIKDFLLMLFFGAGSYVIGLVQFYIPGLDGAVSDLREIPLLISIFHFSNPLFTIGASAISALGTPPDGSYLSTFLMHAISLFVS